MTKRTTNEWRGWCARSTNGTERRSRERRRLRGTTGAGDTTRSAHGARETALEGRRPGTTRTASDAIRRDPCGRRPPASSPSGSSGARPLVRGPARCPPSGHSCVRHAAPTIFTQKPRRMSTSHQRLHRPQMVGHHIQARDLPPPSRPGARPYETLRKREDGPMDVLIRDAVDADAPVIAELLTQLGYPSTVEDAAGRIAEWRESPL